MNLIGFLTIFSVFITFGNADVSDFPDFFSRGYFQRYELKKDDFFKKSMDVSFNFSTELDYPELPSWLHLEQRRSSAPAFLYGAPGQYDESTKIEVIGWDKKNYSAVRFIQGVNIVEEGFPYFQAEFFIKNKTLDKFLDEEYKEIVRIVRDNYWNSANLGLTLVISAIGHGGRIPLPGSNNHEGVIVHVGSTDMWPTGNNSELQPGEEPKYDYFKDNGFEINWSRFKWIDLRGVKSPEAERQALLPPDRIIKTVSYAPPVFDDSERDFDIDFILIVVIPIIVIILFVIIISLIMCCGREGKRKRDQATPNIKLTHHHNIQRSTLRLRELSKPRENTPQHPGSDDPTRPAHAHGDYARLQDDDDDRTDGRNAPPPYRMPAGSAGKGEAQPV